MNLGEVASLLAVITDIWATLTPRSNEDAQLRAMNWHASLDDDMPYTFAVEAVHRHAATPGSDEPKPYDLNARWRAHKAAQAHERTRKELAAASGVPPTPEFYAAWRELRERKAR